MIYYEVNAYDPFAHLFDLSMQITMPHPEGQMLSLPIWIPGSYMIRDFARHIVSIEAYEKNGENRSKIKLTKINSHTWQCAKATGMLTIRYTVYAFDASVRGAYLDPEYAFFNGASLFLCPKGQEDAKSIVKLGMPNHPNAKAWKVATTLTREEAPPYGYGTYSANSYDELIDHPVQMGEFEVIDFIAHTIPHAMVITGKHDGDLNRLVKDVQKICETQLAFFKESPPFSHYLFLLHVKKEAYGGLEHRSSSALQIGRECLPFDNEAKVSVSYMSLLALFSHEYFHAWNVKKIKPSVFLPYNLDEKAYTKQLWIYEGITSYYDDLMLVRSKVISVEQYLDVLAQAITKLLRTPGRQKQTLTDASFDAWIKFYQPNENTPNAGVSYYLKGSLVALLIDMVLRIETEKSLDDLMIILWQEFGQKNRGTHEDTIENKLTLWGSQTLSELIDQALYTTVDLPLEKWFDAFGLALTYRVAINVQDLGGKIAVGSEPDSFSQQRGQFNWILLKTHGRIEIVTVLDGGCAQKAGVNPNDEVVAINGLKVNADSVDQICRRLKASETVTLHVFRQDVLKKFTFALDAPKCDTAQVVIKTALSEKQKNNLKKWLDT